MKITMTKRHDGSFMPTYESDLIKAKKIKVGTDVEVEVKKPRNLRFHKKFYLAFRNNAVKITKRQSCCSHPGEPGC